MSGAGFGLKLHDLLYDTNHHAEAFDPWWRHARANYLNFEDDTPGNIVTLYYDPIIDHHHQVPVMLGGTFPALYLSTQVPDDARALFDAGRAQAGMSDGDDIGAPPGPRVTAMTILLAREWGLGDLADRLGQLADERYEPTWDRDRGEFTWGFGLGEEHPRGQYNAIMAAAEVMTEGAWSRLATHRPRSRFDQPVVEGVDFPSLTVTRAWWDDGATSLSIGTAAMNQAVTGRPTTFRVSNLRGSGWQVVIDDSPVDADVADGHIEIHTTLGDHDITVTRR